jgi:type II pantothenate kinase
MIDLAIDFGISNTDAVASIDGELRRWTQPYQGSPSPELVRAILAGGQVDIADVRCIAVTGGRHGALPAHIDNAEVVGVGELQAIGRGGQALVEIGDPAIRREFGDGEIAAVVVSAGSGTAVVAARGRSYAHITGSAVGGGTLLGLARLLIGTADPAEIDALALRGDPNGADLSLADVVSGPIGTLPASATAVNFGRLGRHALKVSREDLAASLVTLVGQVIAVTSINAARAQQLDRVIVIGHLTDMPSIRGVLAQVGDFYGMRLTLPPDAGYATALGALYSCAPSARSEAQ